MKLKTKFLCLIAVLLAVSLGANLVWTSANKHAQMENELREQGARPRSANGCRLGVHGGSNQDRLGPEWPSRMTACTKGLHCAIAGRSIGQLFHDRSPSYTTRFVNFNPRNQAGEPDGFEAAARSTRSTPTASRAASYYELYASTRDEEVFRYVAPMTHR